MLILVRFAPPPAATPSEAEDVSDDERDRMSDGSSDETAVGAVIDASGGGDGVGGSRKKSEVKTGSHSAVGVPAMIPLGTCREVVRTFESFNISPDGSGGEGWGETYGMATLYGPGCVIELPHAGEPDGELTQAMVSVTDEEFAWPVLSRACKAGGWKLMDPESGRTFG